MSRILAHAVFVLAFVAMNLLFKRPEFWSYLPLFGLMFASSLLIYQQSKDALINSLILAFMLRMIALVIMPWLSDDFYRFHWDGLLWTHGINPLSVLPNELITGDFDLKGINQTLFQLLNSPDKYSVYPPIAQLVFGISAFLFPEGLFYSSFTMKLFLVAAEIGLVYYALRLLSHYKLPKELVLLIVWNPLFLIETHINLHFEVIMLCFSLGTIYYLLKSKLRFAALFFALACLTKLLPLIFLPLILLKIKRKSFEFLLISSLIGIIGFTPLFLNSQALLSFESIKLYFVVFEFNAGLYYLLSHLGSLLVGYNPIAILGPSMAVISFFMILLISWRYRKKQLAEGFLMILCCYLIFSTTVHPWYIMSLIVFGIFSKLRFWILWSFTAFLSYSAYTSEIVSQNFWLIALEYLSLLGFLIWEFRFIGRSSADSVPADIS